jgi:hypothetical protein
MGGHEIGDTIPISENRDISLNFPNQIGKRESILQIPALSSRQGGLFRDRVRIKEIMDSLYNRGGFSFADFYD